MKFIYLVFACVPCRWLRSLLLCPLLTPPMHSRPLYDTECIKCGLRFCSRVSCSYDEEVVRLVMCVCRPQVCYALILACRKRGAGEWCRQAVCAGLLAAAAQGGWSPRAHLLPDDTHDWPAGGTAFVCVIVSVCGCACVCCVPLCVCCMPLRVWVWVGKLRCHDVPSFGS